MKLRLLTAILLGSALVACATSPTQPATVQTAQKITVPKTATPTKVAKSISSVPVAAVTPEPAQPATKIAKNMQSVAVSTNPEGASCSIKAGDETLGTVAATPANVVIKRMNWKFGADVTCSKEGFITQTGRLANNPVENEIRGNIGAIFTAVKMLEGSLAAWNDSVHISLKPAYFTSTAQRDAYLDSQTALLNSSFTSASGKYLTCKRKKCARKMAELQTAYDANLASLKADVATIPLK